MTSRPASYSVVSIETSAAAVGALSEWVRTTLGIEPVEIQRPHAAPVWLDLYFEKPAQARGAMAAVRRQPGVRGVTLRSCAARDWTRFWRHHFRTTRIGDHLRMVPIWERKRAPRLRGVKDILLDPGLSFGTGEHFTTNFCLGVIDRLCGGAGRPASMLDAGCGSGILAIACAKLGVPVVEGFDFDPQAVEQAEANLRLNRVGRRIRLFTADITAWTPRRRYDLVCANLFGGLLIRAAPVLSRAARRHLVLTGIREIEAAEVSAAFLAEGWTERMCDSDGEWCGFLLARE